MAVPITETPEAGARRGAAGPTTRLVVALGVTVGLIVGADAVWAWLNLVWVHQVTAPSTSLKVTAVDPGGLYGDIAADDEPLLLLAGDSHLYDAAGRRGEDLATPTGHTVLDELAAQIVRDRPDFQSIKFVRFAAGGFPPRAMLTTIARLLKGGVRPSVVVLAVRPNAFTTDYDEPAKTDVDLARWLLATLADPRVGASEAVLAPYRALLIGGESLPDRLEQRVVSWATSHSGLLSKAGGLRLRVLLYRRSTWGRLFPAASFRYPTSDDFTGVSLANFDTLLRLLRAFGVRTLCYLPPEASVVESPAIRRSSWRRVLIDRIRAIAEADDSRLIDASELLPAGDAWWGWWSYRRDPIHFRPAGHQRLAAFVYSEGQAFHVWDALDSHATETRARPPSR